MKFNKMRFLAVICLAGFLMTDFAQAGEKDKGKKMSIWYFSAGGNMLNIGDLNDAIEAVGYPTISENFYSFGLGGHSVMKKNFILGMEAQMLMSEEVSGNNLENSMDAAYGMLNFGINLWSRNMFRVYPLIGLGYGSLKFKIQEEGTSPTFSEILLDPRRNVTLRTSGFLLNIALGADYIIKFGKHKKKDRGLLVGFRFGYTTTPFKGDWQVNETEITGGPEIGITGPYIRLIIGGGGKPMMKY